MDAVLEQKVIECLDAIEEGQSVEKVLARYPGDEIELKPILEMAVEIASIRVAHTLHGQARSRQNFLEQAGSLRGPAAAPRQAAGILRRFTFAFASLVLIVVILVAGLLLSSSSAVPGDVLYGAKLAIEDVRLSISGNSEGLIEQFERERIREINELLQSGTRADVEFYGRIETTEGDTWIIAGLPVVINADTEVDGEPKVGRLARVIGKTANGILTAQSISIVNDGIEIVPTPPAEIPDVTPAIDEPPTDTPTPTRTPTPSPTVTSTPTPTTITTPTVTSTADPTESATTMITVSPTDDPLQTISPTPDDDEDEDDNSGPGDGDDDNSGSGGGDDDNSGPGGGGDDSSGSGGGDDDNSGPGGG